MGRGEIGLTQTSNIHYSALESTKATGQIRLSQTSSIAYSALESTKALSKSDSLRLRLLPTLLWKTQRQLSPAHPSLVQPSPAHPSQYKFSPTHACPAQPNTTLHSPALGECKTPLDRNHKVAGRVKRGGVQGTVFCNAFGTTE